MPLEYFNIDSDTVLAELNTVLFRGLGFKVTIG